MAQSKKPRKAYRPKFGPKAVPIDSGINGVRAVRIDQMLTATNPINLAIERAAIQRHKGDMILEMEDMPDGGHCPSLLDGASRTIAMGMKVIEGWEDSDSIGDHMYDAHQVLCEFAQNGCKWQAGDKAETVIVGFDVACQVISRMKPTEKLEAFAFVEQIEQSIRMRAEA